MQFVQIFNKYLYSLVFDATVDYKSKIKTQMHTNLRKCLSRVNCATIIAALADDII